MSNITHEIALERFHEQIGYVLEKYQAHGRKASDFNNIVIGGLGGSGIGGRISRLAFYTFFPLPIEVISEYRLPAYAGKNTLVILSSYSGNTEETLSMYAHARELGCEIMVLTSGGKLLELANANSNKAYIAESSFQPRMALGYSLSTLLLVLGELAGIDMSGQLADVQEMLRSDRTIKIRGEEMFHYFGQELQHKFVVICDLAMEAVATRFCQQIQENAKGEAFISILPEANHNMIETYYSRHNTNFLLLNSGVNERNTLRFHYLKKVLEKHGNLIFEYPVKKFNISTIFEVIHATDWLSIFISDAKGVNNLEVQNISALKAFLESNNGA